MDDTFKYLIHADVAANGVVERSDVVGAIFGQTEGLLGEELDLRDLQQSSKVGRIDVEVSSEAGQSFGELTIASSLDRVDTAILAASLETITRVGPCRARVEVTDIEDVREAKRREVVERAKELLAESFDESITSSEEIQAEVREAVRVADITEYEGLPAGPRVKDADAVIVVEGRADVLTLLRYGIKNAVAVEGTNVPDAIADLTRHRTVTAFLDGDRGGELILRELQQVGDIDYAAFAPEGRSVEDLPRHEVVQALQEKLRVDDLPEDDRGLRAAADDPPAEKATADTDGGAVTVGTTSGGATASQSNGSAEASTTDDGPTGERTGAAGADPETDAETETDTGSTSGTEVEAEADLDADSGRDPEPDSEPNADSVAAHARAVVDGETGRVRLLDDDLVIIDEAAAEAAASVVGDAETAPHAVVIDGVLTQRLLDVLAERGVTEVVARETGEFVKRPVEVRIRTVDQMSA